MDIFKNRLQVQTGRRSLSSNRPVEINSQDYKTGPFVQTLIIDLSSRDPSRHIGIGIACLHVMHVERTPFKLNIL